LARKSRPLAQVEALGPTSAATAIICQIALTVSNGLWFFARPAFRLLSSHFFVFPFRAKQSAERTFLSKTFPDISHCHGCGPDSCLLPFPPAFHPGLLPGKNLPEHTAGQNLRLGRECFRNRFLAVNANRGVVLFIDNALHAAIAAVGLKNTSGK